MRWIGSETFWLTRLVVQRALACILLAFLNVVNEFKPLLGEHGLSPVRLFIKAVRHLSCPREFCENVGLRCREEVLFIAQSAL
jgi:hypothetical protein